MLETTNEFRYSENTRYQSTTRKRSCNLCSSVRQTSAWNNVTTLPTYTNFTVINQTKATILVPPIYNYVSRWLIIFKVRDAVTRIVGPLSLLTNSLSIAVFFRLRHQMQDGLFLVFVSLSVVDTFALTLRFNQFFASISRKMALRYYIVGCQMLSWLDSCGQICSSYLVLLYTFERFISVRFPLKRAVICSRRRVCITLLCILVFIPTIQMYHLIILRHVGTSCGIPRGTSRIIYSYLKLYVHFVTGILLPYCCIAVLNALIVYYLKRYERKRLTLQARTMSLEDKKQRTITIMLFTASTYSLTMMMPLILANCIDMTNSITSVSWIKFRTVALHIIAPWNYCGNFMFYVMGGRQFRNELFNIIRCRQPRG